MPLYRMLCIARTQAPKSGATQTLVKKCADEVVKRGGVFQNVESLGNRKLAFKFRQKQGTERRPDYGHFFSMQFVANPETMQVVERSLRLDESVMRFFTHKLDDTKIFSRPTRASDGEWKPKRNIRSK